MPSYLLDVDTGIDDALALMFGVLSGAEIVAIGVVGGNASLERCVDNTYKVLRVLGRDDIPVAAGAARSLSGQAFADGSHVQGHDALGDCTGPMLGVPATSESASEQIIRLSHEHDDLVLVATAPLTNVATALRADPGLAARVGRVVVMGGAVECPGNVSPVAEANFANDPEAAEVVLSADWRVTVVPLDETRRAVFDRERLGAIRSAGTPVASFAGAIAELYVSSYERRGMRGCFLHDPLAFGLALDPGLAGSMRRLPASVSTSGITRGMLVADRRAITSGSAWPEIDIPSGVDAERFVDRFVAAIAGDAVPSERASR